MYIVKSFPTCSLTKYKIEKNYTIFLQDFLNCFEFFFNCIKSLNFAAAFTKNLKPDL